MLRLLLDAVGLSVHYLHVLVIWVGVRLLRGTVGLRMGVGSMRGLVSSSGQSALSTPKTDLALMKPTPTIGLNPTTLTEAEMREALAKMEMIKNHLPQLNPRRWEWIERRTNHP